MPAKIRLHDAADIQRSTLREVFPPDMHRLFDARELDATSGVHESGELGSLQLFEVSYPPDVHVGVHAHEHDEIIYVLEGAMRLGNRLVGPGSSLFVAAHTLYSFGAGPSGLRMLNFRPCIDASYISKDSFLERKARLSASGPQAVTRS